jgi:hypothetical protein
MTELQKEIDRSQSRWKKFIVGLKYDNKLTVKADHSCVNA